MNDLIATLDVKTIVINDKQLSKEIGKTLKQQMKDLDINMFYKKMWILAGEKSNCEKAVLLIRKTLAALASKPNNQNYINVLN